jgi:hypothetical protein
MNFSSGNDVMNRRPPSNMRAARMTLAINDSFRGLPGTALGTETRCGWRRDLLKALQGV